MTNPKLTRCALLSLAILLSALSAAAQGVPIGPGGRSCGQWLQWRQDEATDTQAAMFTSMTKAWLQGFLYGSKLMATGMIASVAPSEPERAERLLKGWTFDLPDVEAMTFWMDKHCREHPLESIQSAAVSLLSASHRKPQ